MYKTASTHSLQRTRTTCNTRAAPLRKSVYLTKLHRRLTTHHRLVTYLGMQARSMNCRSMLQAMIGRCCSGTASGAELGRPSVRRMSTSTCSDDSQRFGSPRNTIAEVMQTKQPLCKMQYTCFTTCTCTCTYPENPSLYKFVRFLSKYCH